MGVDWADAPDGFTAAIVTVYMVLAASPLTVALDRLAVCTLEPA
jgi:hypothetical protein